MSEGLSLVDPGLQELVALDKAYRSPKLEHKLQSILQYTHFFVKYPSPDLVTSGFLKLAEYWRTSNNIVRQSIFKVFKHSQYALTKITSVDDMLRRIFVVLTSNDPIARALTLRLLAYMSAIVQERIEVHHRVRLLLDSNDPLELEAAIFATDRIASKSRTFAANIMDKLELMVLDPIQNTATTAKVFRIFRHMHHDQQLANLARQSCLRYLRGSNDEDYIITIARTLTVLAKRCIFQIDAQVELLIGYLEQDRRIPLQWSALDCLRTLGKAQGHHFTQENFLYIMKFACSARCSVVRQKGFQVLSVLCGHFDLLLRLFHSPGGGNTISQQVSLSDIESIMSQGDASSVYAARTLCKMYTFAQTHLSVNGIEIGFISDVDHATVRQLLNKLASMSTNVSASEFRYTAETLVQLSRLRDGPEVWNAMLSASQKNPLVLTKLFNLILRMLSQQTDSDHHSVNTLISMAIVYLSVLPARTVAAALRVALRCGQIPPSRQPDFASTITPLLIRSKEGVQGYWHLYGIGREAVCAGHYGLAHDIFKELVLQVTSESVGFWIRSLEHVAQAGIYINALLESATNIEVFHKLVDSLRSSSTAIKSLAASQGSRAFQYDLLILHATTLEATQGVLATLENHSDDRVTQSMKWSTFKETFDTCSRGYSCLAESFVDIDDASLDVLDSWAVFCVFMTELTGQFVARTGLFEAGAPEISPSRLYLMMYAQPVSSTRTGSRLPPHLADVLRGIEDESHMQVKDVGRRISQVLRETLLIPSYFFVTRPSVTVQVTVTPNWRNGVRRVKTYEDLILKLEGTVKTPANWKLRGHGREIVALEYVTEVVPMVGTKERLPDAFETYPKQHHCPQNVLRANLAKGYFAQLCAVSFTECRNPETREYVVRITCKLVDLVGNVWRSGPVVELPVSLEGPTRDVAGGFI
ncbi:uncharacterized protein SPPG_02996 [Spizellomyces punctatus DAOM BR117]|uniref:Integrator complex subunit 7 n=1 Tax=Spizellomyces punctatus (strain DAOM BR117) TaxID=645134 RepID=A0A0L0HN97_SPIPD|nr:uncharacterized protein SPPG_02996 [Spizellomyces punctatus DAOM BR117]KND02538.1 hypothetical protein SPPG_02996 [Spizellomyces punctatus DAOM BR117]|eukprot:XP_016610577.1 hypothetical protein SPPG_02996 [Spizellomyces punctatus DAOM BR117]